MSGVQDRIPRSRRRHASLIALPSRAYLGGRATLNILEWIPLETASGRREFG